MASSDHVTCNNNNNNNTQKPSSKQLTFPQLLARYRDLADGKLIVKFHDVIVSMPDAQPSTLATYRCSLNVMQSALAALPCRAQYASLGEAFLRPVTVKGGSLLTAALPDHNRRSKVLSVICCLCQLFPGIPDPGEGDHTQILAHLPAGVRCCLQGPTQSNGWGGSISKLPDLAEVDRGIASLPLGDRTRLAVMLYTDLKWCDTRDNDPLAILNLGAVKVFLPGDPPPNQADMMREAADYLRHIGGDAQPENADHAAAGWLVLDPEGRDCIHLLEGLDNGGHGPSINHYALSSRLSEELRRHYLPRRKGTRWLFTDLAHRDVARSKPYLLNTGRASFLKSVNDRFMRPKLGTTLHHIRSAVLAQQLQQQEQAHADKLRQGLTR